MQSVRGGSAHFGSSETLAGNPIYASFLTFSASSCRRIFCAAFLLLVSFAVRAQMDIVFVGGGVSLSGYSTDITLGQVFVAVGETGGVAENFGVQQTYPDNRCSDTMPTDTAQARGSYFWRGQNFTHSGTYYDVVEAGDGGCDVVYPLRLSVIHKPIPEIFTYDGRVLMVDHLPEGASERIDWGSYRWFSVGGRTSIGNNDYFGIYENGRYQPLQGCFYVEVPADAPGYWVRSNIICLPLEGQQTVNMDMTLAPNPTMSRRQARAIYKEVPQGSILTLYDPLGRQLFTHRTAQESEILLPPLPTGTYTVRVQAPSGDNVIRKLTVR